MKKIVIFDTTLRDGEQSPGVSLNSEEKLQIARQLQKMGVDVIEAGFPATSKGDKKSVERIAREIRGVQIAALARAKKSDIDIAWQAIECGSNPRIHVFLATSDIHLKEKLKISRGEALIRIKEAIEYAGRHTNNIEFSAEDASRSDLDFVCRAFEVAIQAGATVVNFPDTVGYATPDDMRRMIEYIKKYTSNIAEAILSVHCHNDLGLANANALAAIQAGARQVECTVNGIGERAGNTAVEELIMAIYARRDIYSFEHNIQTKEIAPTSRLVSHLTGMSIQPNKAIVGANAFRHESGVHQDGILKNPLTYEIIDPEVVGRGRSNKICLGKHSGRKALKVILESMGYELDVNELDKVFNKVKELADKKQEIFPEDLEAIVAEEVLRFADRYRLSYLHVSAGSGIKPTATVTIKVGTKEKSDSMIGFGPIDAAFKAIESIVGTESKLLHFAVDSITGGTDAQGNVRVRVKEGDIVVTGQGSDPDIITASAKAYLNALNRLEKLKKCAERNGAK